MKHFFTTIIISLSLLLSFSATAQQNIEFSFSPTNAVVETGATIEVGLHVKNWSNMVGAQFNVEWDPTVLRIEGIDSLSTLMPDFLPSSFALPSQTDDGALGVLRAAWFTFNLGSGATVPDDHRLLKMRFTVIGNNCESTLMSVEESSLTPAEFINTAGQDLPWISNNASFLVNGVGCGNGNDVLVCNDLVQVSIGPFGNGTITPDMILEGGPFDFSTLVLNIEEVTCDMVGQSVTLEVTDIVNGNTCWGTLQVEDKVPPVPVVFQKVVVNLNAQGTAIVSVSNIDSGSWDNCTESSNLIFEPLAFTFGTDDIGENEVIITVTDESGNSNQIFATVTVQNGNAGSNDDIELDLGEINMAPGAVDCVPLRVRNFSGVTSLQASIEWDPSVISFSSMEGLLLPGFSNSGSINTTNVNNGIMSFLWFDQTGSTELNLQNNAVIADICFQAIGSTGDFSEVNFTDENTEVEVASGFTPLAHVEFNGSVTIGDIAAECMPDTEAPVPFCIGLSTALPGGSTGVVELFASDFNIGSFDNCTPTNDLRFTFNDINPDVDPDFIDQSNTSAKIFPGNSGTVNQSIFVWDRAGNRDFCNVNIQIGDGASSGAVELEFADVAVSTTGVVCLPLQVRNFTNIEGIQGAISWDPTILQFIEGQSSVLPGLGFADNPVDGKLNFVWIDLTAVTPVTMPSGGAILDVCFNVIGEDGDVSHLSVVDGNTAPIQVIGANLNELEFLTIDGSVTLDSNFDCNLTESDILWPTSVLEINESGINSNNVQELIQPDQLRSTFGFAFSDTEPSWTEDCGLIGWSFNDNIEIQSNTSFIVFREFTIIEWTSFTVFTKTQIIKINSEAGNICDVLPNSFPFGDCDSGHTASDDVEWPDNLNVTDFRISPDELVSVSGVDFEDSRPIFFNQPDDYTATFTDQVGVFSDTKIRVTRTWKVVNTNIPGSEWNYGQFIDVESADFPDLVTVNTMRERPIPDVRLNGIATTDETGSAITQSAVDPSRADAARNGLNVRDHILMREYLLGLPNSLLNHPLIDEAVDLNEDGSASAIDQIFLQRIILGLDETTSSQWMFFKQDNPFGLNVKGHYIGVKPGDLDDDADLNNTFVCEPTEKLVINDQLVNNGEFLSVPLFLENAANTRGMELRLDFDADAIDIVGVTSEQVFDEIIWNINNQNQIVMLFINSNASTEFVNANTPILSIEVQAKQNGLMKDFIGITPNDCSYILTSSYDLMTIESIVDGEILNNTQDLNPHLGVKVYPNPVSQVVFFDVSNVDTTDDVQIELFDILGERIASELNTESIDVSALTPGMYLYKVTINNQAQTGRIIKN